MIKALIIEDDPACMLSLQLLLETEFDDIELLGSADNIEQACKLIDKNKPELVFLDVELGDDLSFDIFSKIRHKDFKTIFCTAHAEYAMQAFEFAALHYLVKPVTEEKLRDAIDRLPKANNTFDLDAKIKTMIEAFGAKRNTILLSTGDGSEIFNIDDIIRCEAGDHRIGVKGGRYTSVYFSNRKPLVVPKLIQKFEDELKDSDFVRVHNSDLVNLKYVKKFHKGKGPFIELKDGRTITISESKIQEFKDKLNLFTKHL